MTDVFFIELNDLLDRCNLADDEKEFLEQLAEFMVFPDRNIDKDPRSNEPKTLFSRSVYIKGLLDILSDENALKTFY